MDKYLPLLLLLIPFGIFGINPHYGHAFSLIIACIGLTYYVFARPVGDYSGHLQFVFKWINSHYLSLFSLYLSLWMLVTVLFVWTGNWAPVMVPIAVDAYLYLAMGAFWFSLVRSGTRTVDSWANYICVLALLEACIGILQWSGLDPISYVLSFVLNVKGTFTLPVGTLGNQNHLAALIAISTPFFFRSWWCMAIPILIFALIICSTTTAFVACSVGATYFWWSRLKYVSARVTAVSGALAAIVWYGFYYHPFLNNPRFDMWSSGWQVITHTWQTFVFGVGPGISWALDNELHNQYLKLWFNYGLLGVSLLLGYILTVWRSHSVLFSAFLIACINMVGNQSLDTVPSSLLIITIVALMERGRQHASS
jgi:hypothetical protein